MDFTINQIALLMGGLVEGDGDTLVNTIGAIETANKGSITFYSNKKYESYLYTTKASGIIINKNLNISNCF